MNDFKEKTEFDLHEIIQILPHRYPFLLIDKIEVLTPGESVTAIKNITVNEPYFQGHFPGKPIMPGVLIIEALAQVGAIAALSEPNNRGKLGLFAGINNVKFRRQVIPGDQLRLEVKLDRIRGSIGKATALATIDGETAASGELTFAIVDNPEKNNP